MNEKKQKIITLVGMWLGAIAGSSTALIYVIAGYFFDWGPGGSMEGPAGRILLVGIPSVLIGAYVGELVVRLLAKKMFTVRWANYKSIFQPFIVVFIGCIAGIMAGWEVAAILGKVTEAIEGLDWKEVLINSPAFSTFYAIPLSLTVGILYAGFVFIYLKRGDE